MAKHALYSGSFGKIGAAVLATKSALFSGSGLTYILAKMRLRNSANHLSKAMYLYGGEDFIKILQ